MEERLLLDWIALHAANVSPGDVESSAAVVPHFADTDLTIGNGATVPTGEATHAVAIKPFIKLAFSNVFVDYMAQGRHWDGTHLHSSPDRCSVGNKLWKFEINRDQSLHFYGLPV